jgi:hypothetical protein
MGDFGDQDAKNGFSERKQSIIGKHVDAPDLESSVGTISALVQEGEDIAVILSAVERS